MTDHMWSLMQGDTHIGTLVLDHIDQPWFHCRFTSTTGWEPIQPTVSAWTRAVEQDRSDDRETAAALEAVDALRLVLVPVGGSETIHDFLIHVEGDHARFRC
ncbi:MULTISPECIES: hypothetical protein [unclassified Streptomyces]|uniref:hypothetical protein n=1 Tax=unclassified Streptomyces TaxID=2593676 RepID=UPI002E2C41BA|nr:hypothetical protein [Streptomyces sp. NBC_00306]